MELEIDLWAPTTRKVELLHDGDRVRVWLTEEGSDVEVRVEDDGDELEHWLADTLERIRDARTAHAAAQPPVLPSLRIWEEQQRILEARDEAHGMARR